MAAPTLVDLPDDILLLVLATLDSARDYRALALSCRRLHGFVTEDGWRVFVRNRFPSLEVPPPSRNLQGWKKTAESLTWQSRCWDKRSLQFQALLPGHPPPGTPRVPRTRERDRGGLFQPVIDAHFDPETHEELVVWGAGENIVARYRQRNVSDGKSAKLTWLQSEGKHGGFTAGYDDVRALKILKDPGKYHKSFLAGRDNGDLALFSSESDQFGKRLVEFRPQEPVAEEQPKSVAQDTINSIDVLHTNYTDLISATTKSAVFLYRLPTDDSTQVTPETVLNLREDVFEANVTQLCRATWMGEDLMALALKGCKDPLRYMTLTPTGWTHHTAAKNPDVEALFGIKYGNICPNSLQPIRSPAGGSATNLLLSAWRDGTCRLQDLRTPSPFDTIYQDNVDPWADMESLMTYGAERFIGGGMNGAAIKIFDFRWPKSYYHTAGLPCLNRTPFSEPSQAFLQRPYIGIPFSRCEHENGILCRWHGLSRHIYYRPNASFFLSNALPRRYSASGIWSLAKPSHLSPNFYIGISGGVIEANLEPSSGTMATPTRVDPNFGFQDWRLSSDAPSEVGYGARPLGAAMMETGDGFAFRQNDRAIRFPRMWMPQFRDGVFSGEDEEEVLPVGEEDIEESKKGFYKLDLVKHHRLDRRYQDRADFWSDRDKYVSEG